MAFYKDYCNWHPIAARDTAVSPEEQAHSFVRWSKIVVYLTVIILINLANKNELRICKSVLNAGDRFDPQI